VSIDTPFILTTDFGVAFAGLILNFIGHESPRVFSSVFLSDLPPGGALWLNNGQPSTIAV
jgi:hypothetical protein